MVGWFKQLDRILRGDATCMESLNEREIDISSGGIIFVIVLLGVFYGLCMGSFTLIRTGGQDYIR